MKSTTSSELKLPIDPINQHLFNLFIEFLNRAPENPVFRNFDENILADKLKGKLDRKGKGSQYLYNILKEEILIHSMNLHNPMYMGHQVPPSLPLASMLDLIISNLNQSMAVTKMSPVISLIENDLIEYLSESIGYSENAGGTITSGGSISNLLGIFGARKKFFKDNMPQEAVVLCSDQSHFSVAKSANVIGLSKNQVISIETDNRYKINVDKTEEIILSLKKKGKIPFVISANAGSTSTGSFDDINKLAHLASKYNIWLHIDGAHGCSLIYSEDLRKLLEGIEKADSISWDAHKMMFMPSSLGICLFKNVEELKNCFKENQAPYLYNSKDACKDLSKISIQCTRRADALKLWGSILCYGTDFFAERYEHLSKVTKYFYNKTLHHKYLEPIHEPEFNIFCFRYNPLDLKLSDNQLNDLNAEIRDLVNDNGETMLTLTSIKGKVSLRVTIINPATDYEHIDYLIKLIDNTFLSLHC
ncbi:MAG: aminotransferase class I/II-fold pyridoxal phosphate-dependent enzyme [Cyanobacteriota bacterium]